jgi:hypothetical protein
VCGYILAWIQPYNSTGLCNMGEVIILISLQCAIE